MAERGRLKRMASKDGSVKICCLGAILGNEESHEQGRAGREARVTIQCLSPAPLKVQQVTHALGAEREPDLLSAAGCFLGLSRNFG